MTKRKRRKAIQAAYVEACRELAQQRRRRRPRAIDRAGGTRRAHFVAVRVYRYHHRETRGPAWYRHSLANPPQHVAAEPDSPSQSGSAQRPVRPMGTRAAMLMLAAMAMTGRD